MAKDMSMEGGPGPLATPKSDAAHSDLAPGKLCPPRYAPATV